jgi:hypothetical protein
MIKLQEDALENYHLKQCDTTQNASVTDFKSAVEGTPTRLRTADFVLTPDNARQPYPQALRIQTAPSPGAQPVGPMSHDGRARCIVSMDVTDLRVDDDQQVYGENRLGCSRGMIWATVFQISVAIAIAICWRLYLLLR